MRQAILDLLVHNVYRLELESPSIRTIGAGETDAAESISEPADGNEAAAAKLAKGVKK